MTTTIGEYTGGGGFQEDDAIYALTRSTQSITLVAATASQVIEQDDACL